MVNPRTALLSLFSGHTVFKFLLQRYKKNRLPNKETTEKSAQ
jgi:hypothetical protein